MIASIRSTVGMDFWFFRRTPMVVRSGSTTVGVQFILDEQ